MSADASDSEEEILVYAELEDSVNINKYSSIHVLGVSGKNPIIQMDGTFFMGKYENALGTHMFFEEDPVPQSQDQLFDKLPEKNLRYLFKTRKLLNMEHAYVTPKEGKEDDLQNQLKQHEDDIQPVSFNSLQEALETFKLNWNTIGTADPTLDPVKDIAKEKTSKESLQLKME